MGLQPRQGVGVWDGWEECACHPIMFHKDRWNDTSHLPDDFWRHMFVRCNPIMVTYS